RRPTQASPNVATRSTSGRSMQRAMSERPRATVGWSDSASGSRHGRPALPGDRVATARVGSRTSRTRVSDEPHRPRPAGTLVVAVVLFDLDDPSTRRTVVGDAPRGHAHNPRARAPRPGRALRANAFE